MENNPSTQEALKKVLNYCPASGVFTWASKTSNCIKVGDHAGCLVNEGYIVIQVLRKREYAHRLAFLYMEGRLPSEHVDHINHERNDNRWNNLRLVSREVNQKNQKKRVNNTSGFTGVSWVKRNQKWQAYININGKRTVLGEYSSLMSAVFARAKAEKENDYHKNHGI